MSLQENKKAPANLTNEKDCYRWTPVMATNQSPHAPTFSDISSVKPRKIDFVQRNKNKLGETTRDFSNRIPFQIMASSTINI